MRTFILAIMMILAVLASNSLATQKSKSASPKSTTDKKSVETPSKGRQKGMITPFGGIQWEDSIYETANRLVSLSPDELKVAAFFYEGSTLRGVERGKLEEYGYDIKGFKDAASFNEKLHQGKNELCELLSSTTPGGLDCQDGNFFGKKEERNYADKDGAYKFYLPVGISMYASPVIISGVPFSVLVHFTSNAGLALERADFPIFNNGDSGLTAFPLVIREVRLEARRSPLLSQNIEALKTILKEKFRGFQPDEYLDRAFSDPMISMDAMDDKGQEMAVKIYEEEGIVIRYKSNAFDEKLDKAYSKHLAGIEAAKLKGKSDAGSKL